MKTWWKSMDGSHPGYDTNGKDNPNELLATSNVCTAQNGNGGSGVWANARCCIEDDPDYILDCKQIWGEASGNNEGDYSSVSCPSGYFMSGCNVFTYWQDIDGARIIGDTCYAYNGHDSRVWAVAVCCAQYFEW